MGFKELAYTYSESLFEWKKEVSQMYVVFKNIDTLRSNPNPDKSLSIGAELSHIVNNHLTEIHPYSISDHSRQKFTFKNKKEEKVLNLLSNQYLSLKDKVSGLNITTDERMQLIKIEKELTEQYHVDIISLEEEGELYKSSFFLRPMMRTFNLLGSMYFAIFQMMQSSTSISICKSCGSPFVVTPRKEIKDKCPVCVVKERNKRKNDKKRSDPIDRFKENVGQRVRYQLIETLNVPIENGYILEDWYQSMLDEPKKNISNINKWIKDKDNEFYEILKTIKKED